MPGIVYFVESAGAIKIGFTLDLPTRLKAMATGNPCPLTLIGYVEGGFGLEKAIHAKLKDYRLMREWFHDHPAVRDLLDKLQTIGPSVVGHDEPKFTPIPSWENKRSQPFPWLELTKAFHKIIDLYGPSAKRDRSIGHEIQRGLNELTTLSKEAFETNRDEDEELLLRGRHIVKTVRKNLRTRIDALSGEL